MSRKKSFEETYGASANTVLSSIGQVGAAGRSVDQAKIEAEQKRHYRLMASLPKRKPPSRG
jgi:hypothetical protein